MIPIMLLTAAAGLLLVGLAVPMLRDKVPPNAWYGFRIRLTLDNANNWYPVNAWANKWLRRLGIACTVTGLAALLPPSAWLEWVALGLSVGAITGVLAIFVAGSRTPAAAKDCRGNDRLYGQKVTCVSFGFLASDNPHFTERRASGYSGV